MSMNTSTNVHCLFSPDSSCRSATTISYSSRMSASDDRVGMNSQGRASRGSGSSVLVQLAVRISRARWFSFLRRVFHYQNGSWFDLGSNPFSFSERMLIASQCPGTKIRNAVYACASTRTRKK